MALGIVSLFPSLRRYLFADNSAFNTFNLTKLILCRILIMKSVGTCEEDTVGTSHTVSYFDNQKGRDV